MSSVRKPPERKSGTQAPTPARARTIEAALDLFARHGIGGTSLQMIANEVGVTKAAIYHQYPSKEQIVTAAAEAELGRVLGIIDAAEAEPPGEFARDFLIDGMVNLAVERRRKMGTILGDPMATQLFADNRTFRIVMNRLRRLLFPNDGESDARIRTAVLVAAISGPVMQPFVVDLDDELLRKNIRRLARLFLGLPE